ncbi:LysR family transcriptional regulator [Pseudovibrio sp. Tun.PSC04-5.I4]|uniref:LysR family transcriptional regulator n=1 Tax=Pseudovibrio sp. Tun.PSC04-5.I4 TaxID=1798213 RepID=UPI0008840882|nr:LysR family transcriptional regulator [Pseudovibrio sp. Tun.PSC04-5.I4]SDR47888.1 DNA-binding transcriptional regulator, LysR family [Pseudovibrio sp. Tun.PSC04-5.I4]
MPKLDQFPLFSARLPELAVRALPLVREVGSITKTAHRLGVSQSAVSQSIAELEKRLGIKVLIRGAQPVQLTEEGVLLSQYAQSVVIAEEKALAQIDDLRHNRGGRVRIGSSGPSASTRLLPSLMQRFSQLYPGIALELREAQDHDIIAALRRGEVDVAVVPGAKEESEFETIPLAYDRLVGIVSSEKAEPGSLKAADFQNQPFIMTKGGSEPLVRKWFNQSDIEPRVDHSIQQITSILALVKAGLAHSIIAELALPRGMAGVRVLPLDPPAPRSLYLTRLPTTPANTASSTFWTFSEYEIYRDT